MIPFGVQPSSSVFFHFVCPIAQNHAIFSAPFSFLHTGSLVQHLELPAPNTKRHMFTCQSPSHPPLVVSKECKAVTSRFLVLGQLTVLKVHLECTPAQPTLLAQRMKAVPQSFRGGRISVSGGCCPLTLPLSWRKVISSRILPSAGSHTPPVFPALATHGRGFDSPRHCSLQKMHQDRQMPTNTHGSD